MARELTLGCKATSPMVLGNGNKTPSTENRGRTSTTNISHDAKPRIRPHPYPKHVHVHRGRPGGILHAPHLARRDAAAQPRSQKPSPHPCKPTTLRRTPPADEVAAQTGQACAPKPGERLLGRRGEDARSNEGRVCDSQPPIKRPEGSSGPGGEGRAGWEEMCGRGINRLFDGETTSGKANGGDRRAARCQGVRARRRAMLSSSNGSDAPGWEQDRQVAVIRRHMLYRTDFWHGLFCRL